MPMAMVRTAVATRLHVVERTLRNFVHSARRAPAKRWRPGGTVGRPSGAVSGGPDSEPPTRSAVTTDTGTSPLHRGQPVAGTHGWGGVVMGIVVDVEFHAVACELHESVLERGHLG